MSRRLGERIRELERDIKKELEILGIINVNFFYENSQKPMVEYTRREPQRNIHCEELKKGLISRIQTNVTGIQKINHYLDPTRNVYVLELIFYKGFGISDQSTHHGLLSLTYQEIQNHKRRFGI